MTEVKQSEGAKGVPLKAAGDNREVEIKVETETSVELLRETDDEIRNRYRTALVGNTPLFKRKKLIFFDLEIELHQPSLDAIMGKIFEGGIKERMTDAIINYAYVPDTNIQIFEEADAPQILKWPFGADWKRMQDAITELLGLDITETEEELKSSPLAEDS